MRLINITHLDNLKFHEVADPNDVCYAILSHVWNNNEPTFRDLELVMQDSGGLLDPKFSKLMGFIQAAVAGGYQFVWADMCCIDSTNSDEVTAATASMYSWYSSADVCYAYLRDVPTPYHEEDALPPGPPTEFSQSVWFTRAWTLQELLAPKSVFFFSTDWKVIGTKQGLSEIIEDITGIDVEVLTGKRQVQEMCMSCRMSWAENRTASKPEDRVYALMGILGIRIPVLYGKGAHAFVRLEEEIERRIAEATLLALRPRRPLCNMPLVLSAREHIRTDLRQAVRARAHPESLPPLPDWDSGCLFPSAPDTFRRVAQLTTGTPQHSTVPIFSSASRTVFRGGGPSRQNIIPFRMLQLCTLFASLTVRVLMNVEDTLTKPFHLIPLGCSTANAEFLTLSLCPSTSHKTSDFVSPEDHQHQVIGACMKDIHDAPSYILVVTLSSSESHHPEDRHVFRRRENMGARAPDREVCLPPNASVDHLRAADDFREADNVEGRLREDEGRLNIHLAGRCKSALEAIGFPLNQIPSPKNNPSQSTFLLLRAGSHTFHVRYKIERFAVKVIDCVFSRCLLLHPGFLADIRTSSVVIPLVGTNAPGPHAATSHSQPL